MNGWEFRTILFLCFASVDEPYCLADRVMHSKGFAKEPGPSETYRAAEPSPIARRLGISEKAERRK